jgi:uncharacterized repeat protein (TIGR03843 family)
VQRFVHHDPEENYFTLLPNHVERMREFAILDVLVNNADRKGGHCLRDPATDTVFGIDHGLTFHAQWKLRTVIWDFANEALTDDETDAVRRVLNDESLDEHLHALLNRFEVDAFRIRGEALLAEQLPEPEDGHYSFPWPLV